MACKSQREQIDVYLDNELDVAASLELQQHLRECESCAQLHRQKQALRSAIRGSDLTFRAPPGLERRIRGAGAKAGGTGESRARSNRTLVMWLAVAASLAIVLALV